MSALPASPTNPDMHFSLTGWRAALFGVTVLAGFVMLAILVGLSLPSTGVDALIALLAAAIALAAFLRPRFGMFVFAVMLYSRASEVLTSFHGVPSIAPLFAVLLLTAVVAREGLNAWNLGSLADWQFIILYGLVMLASALVAITPHLAISAVVTYARDLTYIAIALLVVRNRRDLRLFVWALIAAAGLPAIFTVFQAVSGSQYTFLGFGRLVAQIVVPGQRATALRPAGPVGDPNFFALTLAPIVVLALHQSRFDPSRPLRRLAMLAALTMSVAVFLTYSRGELVALCAGLVLAGFAGYVRLRALAAVALIAVLALPFLPSSYLDRTSSIAQLGYGLVERVAGLNSQPATTNDTSVVGRRSELLAGVEMFLDHPFIGVGVANYPEHFQDYARPLGISRRGVRAPHNLYVEIAAETGVIGLAAFAALIGSTLGRARGDWLRTRASATPFTLAQAIYLAIITYLVGSLFLHAAYPRYLWMLLGLALAAHVVARRERVPAETRRTFVLPRVRLPSPSLVNLPVPRPAAQPALRPRPVNLASTALSSIAGVFSGGRWFMRQSPANLGNSSSPSTHERHTRDARVTTRYQHEPANRFEDGRTQDESDAPRNSADN